MLTSPLVTTVVLQMIGIAAGIFLLIGLWTQLWERWQPMLGERNGLN